MGRIRKLALSAGLCIAAYLLVSSGTGMVMIFAFVVLAQLPPWLSWFGGLVVVMLHVAIFVCIACPPLLLYRIWR
ncbi:MAG: hypothetical protein WBN89_01180 [Prochlorococcaceae cyanobacterium]